MSSVELVWVTPEAESIIAHNARVSNPNNQDNPDYKNLIKYCLRNRHWSIFDQVNVCIEIKTSRAVSAQILRHWSHRFQEYSQRYAEVVDVEYIEVRRKGKTNRQSSEEVFDPDLVLGADYPYYASEAIEDHVKQCKWLYKKLVDAGVALECARMVLPIAASTNLYSNATLRSWIHYLELRNDEHAQKEHRLIAIEIENILRPLFPIVFAALDEIKQEETFKDDVYTFLKSHNITSVEQLKDLLGLPIE